MKRSGREVGKKWEGSGREVGGKVGRNTGEKTGTRLEVTVVGEETWGKIGRNASGRGGEGKLQWEYQQWEM